MTITIQKGELTQESCDLLALGVFEGALDAALNGLDKAYANEMRALFTREGFTGRLKECQVVPTLGQASAKKIVFVGLGARAAFATDGIRKYGGQVAKIARTARARTVCTALVGAGVRGIKPDAAAQALGEGLRLGSYQFKEYRGTGTKAGKDVDMEVAIIEPNRAQARAIEKGLTRAEALADATALARDLVNTPSFHMHPDRMAHIAQSLVTRGRIRCKVLDKDAMEKLGMEAALSVGAGSEKAPVGIHLTYTPARRPKKSVAVIGKAVTFDSGGLNIKPEQGMTTMKIDMAGAASVLGLFKALATLNVPVEVHGVFLAVENMISGNAYRPGDVVRAMDGQTIEILNTDAEGRVTLADAIGYTVSKIKPDVMVDLATLTGAVIVALGDDITGIMGNDPSVVSAIQKASADAGERTWELPLVHEYDDAMKSHIADMNNTGGRAAGAIKAGLFLQRFVHGTPWAHMDIAGPSYAEKETRPDTPVGGTGWGVRTLFHWLEQM